MINLNLYFGIFFAVFIFVILFIIFSPVKKSKIRDEKQMIRTYYINKISWLFLICLFIYYAFSIPFVGTFYQSDRDLPRLNYDAEQVDVKSYLIEHQSGIRNLETELNETKKELRELKNHYREIFTFLFIGITIFGGVQIFGISKQQWLDKHLDNKE